MVNDAGSINLFINSLNASPAPERVRNISMKLALTKTITFINIILTSALLSLFQAFLKSSIIKFAIISSKFRIYFSNTLK